MGKEQEYRCNSCGAIERLKEGSGMTFERVRCELCGKSKNIPRYQYQEIVDGTLPPCECGGKYTLEAPLRCSACGSTDITPTGEGLVIEYD